MSFTSKSDNPERDRFNEPVYTVFLSNIKNLLCIIILLYFSEFDLSDADFVASFAIISLSL